MKILEETANESPRLDTCAARDTFTALLISLLLLCIHSSCHSPRFQIAGAYNDSIMERFNNNTSAIQLLDSTVYSQSNYSKGKIAYDSAVAVCSRSLNYIKSIGAFEDDDAWQKEAVEFFTNDLDRVKRFDKLLDMLKENTGKFSAEQSDSFDSIYDIINDESITDCKKFYDAQRHFADRHEITLKR